MDCTKITYNSKKYCVCKYMHKKKTKYFVIDSNNLNLLEGISKSWHRMGSFIGCSKTKKDGTKTIYYVHKIIMAELIGQKKGYSIEHINGNIEDNRKVNLHLITKLDKKKLKLLKNDCGNDIINLPKEIKYEPERKRFVVEIKRNGEIVFLKKLMDDASLSVDEKLQLAIKELSKIYKQNPEYVRSTKKKIADPQKLSKEFDEIVKQSLPKKNNSKQKIIKTQKSKESDRKPEYVKTTQKSKKSDSKPEYAKTTQNTKTFSVPEKIVASPKKQIAHKTSANYRNGYGSKSAKKYRSGYGSKTSKPKEALSQNQRYSA